MVSLTSIDWPVLVQALWISLCLGRICVISFQKANSVNNNDYYHKLLYNSQRKNEEELKYPNTTLEGNSRHMLIRPSPACLSKYKYEYEVEHLKNYPWMFFYGR
jgi:hypothetical protein